MEEEPTTTLESIPTTLCVLFFGPNGDKPLTFGHFSTFLANFQREMIQSEFVEYSRGQDIISPKDFANILLKYSSISQSVHF
jgi:hypothetical protein